MSTECKYLYGIMPADKARRFGAIGMDGGDVRVVTHGGIAVVASAAERIDFLRLDPEKTLQYLAEHQRVLERVMVDSSVIPLKFGMFADDDRQILGILRSGRKIFARALEKYAGKFELDLVASWADLQAVLSEIATEQPVVSMKAEVSAHREPTTEQRVQLAVQSRGSRAGATRGEESAETARLTHQAACPSSRRATRGETGEIAVSPCQIAGSAIPS